MPTLVVSHGAVHYREMGQGAALILLSANPGESRDYAAVMPALAEHYRVLALDWPGYGESAIPVDAEHWTAPRFAAVLREFIDALHLPKVLIIGNSVGGNAAARLAAESADRVIGLVLVAPGGFTAHNLVTRLFCRLMGSRFALSPRRWAGLYLRKNTSIAQEMLDRAAGYQKAPQRLALNRALWRSFGSGENDLRQIAQRISAPTLLMFGTSDPAIPARKDGRHAADAMRTPGSSKCLAAMPPTLKYPHFFWTRCCRSWRAAFVSRRTNANRRRWRPHSARRASCAAC